MAYITYEEFLSYPLGVTITEEEFENLCFYAETEIDNVTYNRSRKVYEAMEAIKKATAIQIAFLSQNGGTDAALSGDTISSESIGSYSYSLGGAASGSGAAKRSPIVKQILQPTGLLYAGSNGCAI